MKNQSIIMQKEAYGVSVLIVGNRCFRCGHSWVPRNLKDIPEICPSCKSPYWKTPKTRFRKGEKKNGKT